MTINEQITNENEFIYYSFNESKLSEITKEVIFQYILNNFDLKVAVISGVKYLIVSKEVAKNPNLKNLLYDLSISETEKPINKKENV